MKKIMIVDDERHALRILRLSLERHGYEVSTFNNGQDAFEALQQMTPDVLITDIQMPRMTGEELCKNIEQSYPQRGFLIIVVTSRTEIEHREWSANIENLNFLEKPLSMRNLVRTLDEYFGGREQDQGSLA